MPFTKSKTTSIVSQKTIIEKYIGSQPEGSDQLGEGTRENQENQKNKVGESNQPNRPVSSQKDAVINKDSNTSLSISSQKGMVIEKSSQPRAQNMGDDT